jgi:hypothetical protein
MFHKKRGDAFTDVAFLANVKLEYVKDGAWTYYTSDTYPDGIIPTGLLPDTGKDEMITTILDPPFLAYQFRMYFLPHSDGKLRKGNNCAADLRVDFTTVF